MSSAREDELHPPEPEPFRPRAPVTVCVDVKSPQSYLALAPTFELADDLGVTVDWLPVVVPPLAPPEPVTAAADRGWRHRSYRARYRERDLERYAGIRGLRLERIYRVPDTTLAGIALLWIRHRFPGTIRRYLEALFEPYWQQALDVEDPDALGALLERLELDPRAFAAYGTGEGKTEHARLQACLRAAGVFAAPTYLVEGDLFVGREHLPMIRWILEGRTGPLPI